MERFQIFGSENSLDYDVMVFVDEIPEIIDQSHTLCKMYDAELSKILTDKPLNCNLAIVEDGFIVKVFKGTPDEVNNALFYTYDFHTQYHPLVVKESIVREYDMKILRAYRNILSFFSRSHLRTVIKPALRGDLRDKIPVMKMIDFEVMKDFPGKKESIKDIYKVMAFQFGQLFSLVDGFEKDSYTKSGLIQNYPDLAPMLRREELSEKDYKTLNIYLDRLIKLSELRVDKMLRLVE
jgi:hypothetical protein